MLEQLIDSIPEPKVFRPYLGTFECLHEPIKHVSKSLRHERVKRHFIFRVGFSHYGTPDVSIREESIGRDIYPSDFYHSPLLADDSPLAVLRIRISEFLACHFY